MNNDLYFIPLIEQAMDSSDREKALHKAFENIREMGAKPEHEDGYAQFERFIQCVANEATSYEEQVEQSMTALMIELTTDTFQGTSEEAETAFSLIHSTAEWQERFEKLREEVQAEVAEGGFVELILEKDGEYLQTMSFTDTPGIAFVPDVTPGSYALRSSSDQIIWQGELLKSDLVWSIAFAGEPLDLAADTGGGEQKVTRRVELIGGDVILQVLPGLKTGKIQLLVC